MSTPASKKSAALRGQFDRIVGGAVAKVHRAGDLGLVAAFPLAVIAQHAVELHPGGRRVGERHVPLVGPAGDGTQRALRPLAADHEWELLLDRLRFAPGIGDGEVVAGEVGDRVVEERADDLDALVEAIEPLGERAELDAVGVRLHHVPAGTHAELEPTTRDDVERGGHVRRHGWMPVVHPVHHRPEAETLRGLRQSGQHRPALEVRTVVRLGQRIEVVPVPGRLEHRDPVGLFPGVEEFLPRSVVRRRLDRMASHAPDRTPPATLR